MLKKTIFAGLLSPCFLMSSAFALEDDWLPEIPYDYKPPAEIYANSDSAQLVDIKAATEAVYENTQAAKKEKTVDGNSAEQKAHTAGLKAYIDPASGQFTQPPTENNNAVVVEEKGSRSAQAVVSKEDNAALITPSPVEGGGLLLDVRSQVLPSKVTQ